MPLGLAKCVECSDMFSRKMGQHYCPKCDKTGTPRNTFDKKKQLTNREIDALRGYEKEGFERAKRVLESLIKRGELEVSDSVDTALTVLNEQIELYK